MATDVTFDVQPFLEGLKDEERFEFLGFLKYVTDHKMVVISKAYPALHLVEQGSADDYNTAYKVRVDKDGESVVKLTFRLMQPRFFHLTAPQQYSFCERVLRIQQAGGA